MTATHRTGLAALLAAIASFVGCSIPGAGDCDLLPVKAAEAFELGPAPVGAASCPGRVEVAGLVYDVGVGRWLDEGTLELERYDAIERSNMPLEDATAFELAGVDPERILLMRSSDVDDLGAIGPWAILQRGPGDIPTTVCQYADPDHAQTPEMCTGGS